MKVLDIGCGPGQLARYFRPEDYTGIDVSTAYVQADRCRFGGRFLVLPAERVGELPGAFDLAFLVGVFHHLPDDGVRATLAGLRQVLEPGGQLRLLEAVWPASRLNAVGWLARWLDRGRFVRGRQEWELLLAGPGWHLQTAQVTRRWLIEYFECVLTPALSSNRGAEDADERQSA